MPHMPYILYKMEAPTLNGIIPPIPYDESGI